MKYSILLLLLVSSIASCTIRQGFRNPSEIAEPDPAHTSRNSLDWAGTYRYITTTKYDSYAKTEIRLNNDLTFRMHKTRGYNEWDVQAETGTFEWDKSGSIIFLNFSNPNIKQQKYKVGENKLIKQCDDRYPDNRRREVQKILLKSHASEITDNLWYLKELFGQTVLPSPDKLREAHMILRKNDNRVSGNTGCNNFFGQFELVPPNLVHFSHIGSTKMACPDMQPELQFFRLLDLAHSYTLFGDTLIINDSNNNTIAIFETL